MSFCMIFSFRAEPRSVRRLGDMNTACIECAASSSNAAEEVKLAGSADSEV